MSFQLIGGTRCGASCGVVRHAVWCVMQCGASRGVVRLAVWCVIPCTIKFLSSRQKAQL